MRKTPMPVALSLALALPAAAPLAAQPAAFDVGDPPAARPSVRAAAGPADWSGAPLFPLAAAIAQGEARRAGAPSADQLAPGPDGTVDLTLATVIDLTLRHNLDLLVQSYEPALAAETVRLREAIFDPLMQFTVSLFSTTNPTTATLAGAEVLTLERQQWDASIQRLLPWGGTGSVGLTNLREDTNNRFSTLNPSFDAGLTFDVRQPLLRDFGTDLTRREIRIARNSQTASREEFRRQVMVKVADAIAAYWNLYGNIENLAVQREGLTLAQDLLRINRTRVEVGTMAPLDVTSAEAEVARNDENVIGAEADVQNAKDALLQLLGVARSSPLWQAELRPVDAPVTSDQDIDVEEAIRIAIEHRPELKQQDLALDNDRIRLDYARNQLKPGLNLVASYGLSGIGGTELVRGDFGDGEVLQTLSGGYGDAIDQLFSFDFDTWRVGVELELPLFNQAARAQHAQALLGLRRDQDAREQLELAIAVEVRRLARAVVTSRKQIEAAGATRRLQEKRLDAESKKFEHGLSTNFQVQEAQKDLTEARSGEVRAITVYRQALAALQRAMGTLLDAHDIRVVGE